MIDQAARVRLLLALPRRGEALASEVHDLYRHGDSAERIAVSIAWPTWSSAAA
jgi:hypothetical protein